MRHEKSGQFEGCDWKIVIAGLETDSQTNDIWNL